MKETARRRPPGPSSRAAPVPACYAIAVEQRRIPSTGELLPVIGLGTWQTFDVDASERARAPLADVLRGLFAAGGSVIDSSPMYGRAEQVTGDLLAQLGDSPRPFLATKVWTRGKAQGIAEMERSLARLRTPVVDLMQVHNLLDWQTHLPTLRAWKAAGKIRYLGITHYAHSAFDDLERLMRTERVDFVQLPYSLADREAEKRLLPAARDLGVAVLVMRPMAEGALFARVRGRELPSWAADFDCTSWASFFLKFVLAQPAVTAPIPATSRPEHAAQNLAAGTGRLPDAPTLRRMIEQVG